MLQRIDFPIQRDSFGSYAAIAAVLETGDGTPIDLRGADIDLSTNFGLSATSRDGSLQVDRPKGIFAWFPTRADVQKVPYGRVGAYELCISFPGGFGGPFLYGYFDGDGEMLDVVGDTVLTTTVQDPNATFSPAQLLQVTSLIAAAFKRAS